MVLIQYPLVLIQIVDVLILPPKGIDAYSEVFIQLNVMQHLIVIDTTPEVNFITPRGADQTHLIAL